jgi:hypothetical protein
MYLTGWPSSAPLVPPIDVLGGARTLASAVERFTGAWGSAVRVDVPAVLFGRAARRGVQRAGRTSVGGTCRLLETGDGWVAVNLPRQTDIDSVPAIVGRELDGRREDPWEALGAAARSMAGGAFVERAQLLGVPAAALATSDDTSAVTVERIGESGAPALPLVVDLSAMWAGPLCTRLLTDAGARVIKVESSDRPDGARAGDPAFYDWLHAGQEDVVIDFASGDGRRRLHQLVAEADVIVEGSRPRALRQLGIDAKTVLRARPGVTWVSITGYGHTGDEANRVAFGDDAAVAGGLVAYDHEGSPVFCGDAIADPLTGLAAAAAVAESIAAGGGRLIAVALAGVAAHVVETGSPIPPCEVVQAGDRWLVRADGAEQEVVQPSAALAPVER